MSQKKAYCFAWIVVLSWSTVATAFKVSLGLMSYLDLLFWASLSSTVVLGISIVLQGKLRVLTQTSSKQFKRSFLIGLLNPLIYYILLFKAYDRLAAQEAQAINYTWAVLLPIFCGIFLKEKLYKTDIYFGLLAYFGLYVVVSRGDLLSLNFSDSLGVLLAFASTFAWTFYWIFNSKSRQDSDCSLFLSFLCSLPFSFYLASTQEAGLSTEILGITSAAYVGLFEMGLSFTLWNQALKLSDNTAKMSQLVFLSPCLSLLILGLVYKEKILPSTIVGLGIIVLSLVLSKNFDKISNYWRKKQSKQKSYS